MKHISNLFLIAVTFIVTMPLSAQEMDHSSMHHEHESSSASTMQQTQDQDMHHDQHGTTMNHSSPSDENDMNHSMHGSSSELTGKDTMPQTESHHADHDMGSMEHDMKTSMAPVHSTIKLEPLTQLPPSGKSREAGYDGSYMMENTSINLSIKARCALASRGLIMLDNDSFQKCGGKPIGWSKGVSSTQTTEDHSQHMNH
jgi:hypothetical protein